MPVSKTPKPRNWQPSDHFKRLLYQQRIPPNKWGRLFYFSTIVWFGRRCFWLERFWLLFTSFLATAHEHVQARNWVARFVKSRSNQNLEEPEKEKKSELHELRSLWRDGSGVERYRGGESTWLRRSRLKVYRIAKDTRFEFKRDQKPCKTSSLPKHDLCVDSRLLEDKFCGQFNCSRRRSQSKLVSWDRQSRRQWLRSLSIAELYWECVFFQWRKLVSFLKFDQ